MKTKLLSVWIWLHGCFGKTTSQCELSGHPDALLWKTWDVFHVSDGCWYKTASLLHNRLFKERPRSVTCALSIKELTVAVFLTVRQRKLVTMGIRVELDSQTTTSQLDCNPTSPGFSLLRMTTYFLSQTPTPPNNTTHTDTLPLMISSNWHGLLQEWYCRGFMRLMEMLTS